MNVADSQPRALVDGCPRCRIEAADLRAAAVRARVLYLAATTAVAVVVVIAAALWGHPGAAVTAVLALSVAGAAMATIVRYSMARSFERSVRRHGDQRSPHEH